MSLPIKGFQGTSTLDFPGKLATLIFLGGCNLSCGFCHNPSLVINPGDFESIPEEDMLAELKRRKKFVDGVVISGGEPTLYDLVPFLTEIKKLGLAIKLDTNGLRPSAVETLLEKNLIDFVAMDVKTSPERYGELHNGPVDYSKLVETVEILKSANIDVEFRMTLIDGLVSEFEVERVCELLGEKSLLYFQRYVPEHAMNEAWTEKKSVSKERAEEFVQIANKYGVDARLRGF